MTCDGRTSRLEALLVASDRWECVHFATGAERPRLEAVRERGYHVGVITGEALKYADALFDAIAAAFEFPSYFGRNWDALVDSLEDLDWLDAEGYVLLIDGAGRCSLSEPLERLISIWLAVAQEWSGDGKPFHLVVLTDASTGQDTP